MGRGFAKQAGSLGFDPQHCENWVWWSLPIIMKWKQEFPSSRPFSATNQVSQKCYLIDYIFKSGVLEVVKNEKRKAESVLLIN